MNFEQHMAYLGKNYIILNTEQEFIIHPAALGLLPLTNASLQSSFSCDFHMENYRLILDNITLLNEDLSKLSGISMEGGNKKIAFNGCKVSYSGTVLIASDQVKEYYMNGQSLACFSYQKVLELVFEDGILITTIDQSKAMQRIRKNIELGLRSLNKSRDLRCIKRFINSSFVGDYKTFLLANNRLKYLKEMKKDYMDTKLRPTLDIITEK
ncbi:MAG: hypothetical protein PHF63_13160 [Herbinix sp.]|nr:hypothetical protein [Herbinix sp.]